MTKSSQELLKEIEDLRINHLQRVKKDRKELNEEITSERREKIHEEGRKETENFEKQIKEKMLSDLSSWCLDPQGFFYRMGEGLKGLDFHHNGRNSVKTLNFYNRDYWKEIKDGFINEIKQNSQDWKIEKEIDSKYDGYDWDDSWVIKHKSGRKHYRGNSMFIQGVGFSDEEWTEIENAINNREQIISQKNSRSSC